MSALSATDIQALKDITATHVRAGLAADWEAWTATCADDVMLLPPGAARVDAHHRRLGDATSRTHRDQDLSMGTVTVVYRTTRRRHPGRGSGIIRQQSWAWSRRPSPLEDV